MSDIYHNNLNKEMDDQNKVSFLAKRERTFSKIILHQFKSGQSYSLRVAISFHAAYFTIILLTLVNTETRTNPFQKSLVVYILDLVWTGSVGVTILLLLSYLIVLESNLNFSFQHKDKIIIPGLTFVMTSYTFIVFPLLCQTHFVFLNQEPITISLSSKIIGFASIAIGVILNFLGLTVMRNTMPSTSLFSVLRNDIEFWVHTIVQLTTAFSTTTRQVESEGLKNLSSAACVISFAALVVWLMHARFYRNRLIAKITLAIHTTFVFAKLLNDLVEQGIVQQKYLLWLPVLASLAFKASCMWVERKRWIQVFDKKCSPFERYLGIHIFEDLHFSANCGLITSKQDLGLYLYYCGQIENFIANKPEYRKYCGIYFSDRDMFYQFFQQYLESNPDESAWHLKLVLQFHIISLMASMSYFRVRLAKFQHMKNKFFIGRFEAYLYGVIFQEKIDALYKRKIQEEINEEICMNDLFKYMTSISEMESEDHMIDINLILSFKNEYVGFMDGVVMNLENKRECIKSVESLKKNMVKDGVFIMNQRIHTLDNQLLKKISKLLSFGNETPNYVMAAGIFYFGLIRSDFEAGQKLITRFSNKVKKWELQGKTSLMIAKENMQRESVVLQVCIEKHKAGRILDITPDFDIYLGKPEGKDIIGLNINDLFPYFISDHHKKLMENMNQFLTLLNAQRNFFINGFDGFLREISFIVKIFPSIERSITSVGIIRIIKEKSSHLFLVDQNLKVVGFEEFIFDALGCVQTEKKNVVFTQVSQLSRKLSYHMMLTRLYMEVIQPKAQEILSCQKDHEKYSSMMETINGMISKTGSDGFLYQADRNSIFYPTLQKKNFLIKFEYTDFKGIPYFVAYISFEVHNHQDKKVEDFYYERSKIIPIAKLLFSPQNRFMNRIVANNTEEITSMISSQRSKQEEEGNLKLGDWFRDFFELESCLRKKDLIPKGKEPLIVILANYIYLLRSSPKLNLKPNFKNKSPPKKNYFDLEPFAAMKNPQEPRNKGLLEKNYTFNMVGQTQREYSIRSRESSEDNQDKVSELLNHSRKGYMDLMEFQVKQKKLNPIFKPNFISFKDVPFFTKSKKKERKSKPRVEINPSIQVGEWIKMTKQSQQEGLQKMNSNHNDRTFFPQQIKTQDELLIQDTSLMVKEQHHNPSSSIYLQRSKRPQTFYRCSHNYSQQDKCHKDE